MFNKYTSAYFLLFLCLSNYAFLQAQEVGTNDFQISFTGPDGDTEYEAKNAAMAYNEADNEYLVVWVAKDQPSGSTVLEFEIWGQRLDGTTASPIGEAFRISDMGPEDTDAYGANAPAVAYNSIDNEYLVVWYGDDDTGNAVRNEAEIWGQRIDAATGQEVGQNDFRISRMGPDRNPLADGRFPAIAHNQKQNEYLVVWYGDVFFDGKLEVWGQRLNASGQEIGEDDFRISVMGSNTNINYGGYDPAVTYNSTANEYLVVWYGSNLEVDEGENEIWGQRIDSIGNFVGTDGFRISDIGKDDSKNFAAKSPNVIFNSVSNEYLVVWSGNEEGYDKNDYRSWGQRLDGTTGAEIGENDFLISDFGPGRVLPSENHVIDVAFDKLNNQYLVVWSADDYDGADTDEELEIWAKRVDGIDGYLIEMEDIRLSDVGADGNEEFDAGRPYVVFNPREQEYLVIWEADEADEAFEIYGQRLAFEMVEPTCEDGIQNGTEAGVDCGGNCPLACPMMTCSDTLIEASIIEAGSYENHASITISGIIESTDTVSFAAADYILLQAGFHAEHESYFKAQITACTEALSAPLEQRSDRPVFSIYPNPASEQLTIQFETSFEEQPTFYTLYNLQGQKIRSGRWDQAGSKIQQLDVSQLAIGTYVLQMGNQVKKVVVVRAF